MTSEDDQTDLFTLFDKDDQKQEKKKPASETDESVQVTEPLMGVPAEEVEVTPEPEVEAPEPIEPPMAPETTQVVEEPVVEPLQSAEPQEPDAPKVDEPKSALLEGEYMRRPGTVRIGQRRNKFYTKFVRSMRIALPLLAMLIVVVLVVLSSENEDVIKAPPPKEEVVKQTSIGKNELLKPRFDTYDKEGRPYTITAERAFQTVDSSDVIYLEKPVADSTMSDGAWVALESVAGTYDQLGQTLLLEGSVKLFHDAGYSLVTDKLDIDLETNKAVSKMPVSGHGPIGTLEAAGMSADGTNNILIFTGPAKIVLYDMDNILE